MYFLKNGKVDKDLKSQSLLEEKSGMLFPSQLSSRRKLEVNVQVSEPPNETVVITDFITFIDEAILLVLPDVTLYRTSGKVLIVRLCTCYWDIQEAI